MPAAKRTKPSAALDDTGDVAVLEHAPAANDTSDDLDDLLGELPGQDAELDELDELLAEMGGLCEPGQIDDDLDDFDDGLSEVSEPVPANVSGGKVAPPAKGRAPVEAEGAAEPESEPEVAAEQPEPVEARQAKRGFMAKLPKISLKPQLAGTREISRKAHAGLVALTAVFGVTAVGEAIYILMRPAHAPAAHVVRHTKVTLIPVDYAKVDLTRYRDKTRMLGEGGRELLRNPAVKTAVLNLDNGERLYDDLRKMAQGNPVANHIAIRDNRVIIVSCNGPVCGDKSFKLIYHIEREDAAVCITEKYLNGAFLSYRYGADGYTEQPNCNGDD